MKLCKDCKYYIHKEPQPMCSYWKSEDRCIDMRKGRSYENVWKNCNYNAMHYIRVES